LPLLLKAAGEALGFGVEGVELPQLVFGGLDGVCHARYLGRGDLHGRLAVALGVEAEGEGAIDVGEVAEAALEAGERVLAAAVDLVERREDCGDLGIAAAFGGVGIAGSAEIGFKGWRRGRSWS
jgi:hypothetical protein